MVVIIGGEIVPDDDPRAKARHRQSSSGGTSAHAPGAFQGGAYTMSGGRFTAPTERAAPPPRQPSDPPAKPLDRIAESLGVRGKTITIPAVPKLGLIATTIDVLPAAGAGILCLLFGFRGVLGLVILYVIYNRNQQTAGRAGGTVGQRAAQMRPHHS